MAPIPSPRFPLLILTLNGDEARRQPLIDALNARELNHELFFGVDGRAGLPEAELRRIDRDAARRNMGRDMGDGEFACALSHQNIYERILADGLEGAVVLEDDAIVGDAFLRFLRADGPRAGDLIMLDHRAARVWPRRSRPMPGGVTGWDLALPSLLTTGYSITRRGAAFMVAQSRPVARTADWPCDVTRIGAIALDPRVVDHPPKDGTGPSHLSRERKRRHKPFRFFEAAYWRRWYRKRMAKRLSQ